MDFRAIPPPLVKLHMPRELHIRGKSGRSKQHCSVEVEKCKQRPHMKKLGTSVV